jgi:hypothetical protein
MPHEARYGVIHGYRLWVLLDDNRIIVTQMGKLIADEQVKGIAAFVRQAKDLRLGWGQFPDGNEVIYLYDKGDENFGYATNLQAPQCSEWGYAPFPQGTEEAVK